MKKLPNIYKNVIHVQNNKETFYSKNDQTEVINQLQSTKTTEKKQSIPELLTQILKNKTYSYTKKVRIRTQDKEYETRLIGENNGKILTIDNDIIDLSEIKSLEIIK